MSTLSISPVDSAELHSAATLDSIVSPVENEVAHSGVPESPVHVHDFAGSAFDATALRREESQSPVEPIGADLSTLTAVFGGEAGGARGLTEEQSSAKREARRSLEVEDFGLDRRMLAMALNGEFVAIEKEDVRKVEISEMPAATTASAAEPVPPVEVRESITALVDFDVGAFEAGIGEARAASSDLNQTTEPAQLTFDRIQKLNEEHRRFEASPRPSFSSIFGLNRQHDERIRGPEGQIGHVEKDDKWKKVMDWAKRVSLGKPLDEISRLSEDRYPNFDADAIPPPTRGSDISHRTTSTIRYQAKYGDKYIPTVDLHKRVLELCRSLWVGRPDSDFIITKMGGGGYHRIASIIVKVPSPGLKSSVGTLKRRFSKLVKKPARSGTASEGVFTKKFAHGEFVLRVPRPPANRQKDRNYNYDQMRRNHIFAEACGIDVPRVVHIDTTPDNPLGTRYVLMEKLTGQRLDRVLHRLTTNQKCDVAGQLGRICRTMFDQQRRFMGTVSAQAGDMSVLEPEWLRNGHLHSSALHPPAKIVSLGLQNIVLKNSVPCANSLPSLLDMAAEIERLGGFGGGWHMTHGDFYPRNILISIDAATQRVKVSGIIDWDTLAFLPAVCAAKPPSWLWQADFYPLCGDEDHLDVFAHWSASQHAAYLDGGLQLDRRTSLYSIEEEVVSEDEMIKNTFDVAAGERYCKIAYHEFAFEARKLSFWAYWQMERNLTPNGWVRWVKWWSVNWKGFREMVEVYGWPLDEQGRVRMPPIIRERW